MISSMTGFGSARTETPELNVAVEVKTVNHRHLDLHVRLPNEFQSLEAVVRQAVGDRLKRGRVDVFIRIEQKRSRVRLAADPALIGAYVALVQELQRAYPITGELTMDAISRVPGAITVTVEEQTPEEREQLVHGVREAVDQALGQVVQMRAAEGRALMADIVRRLDRIHAHLETIRAGADGLIDHHRQALAARVAELAPHIAVDSARLEVEVLMHVQKSDIAEEITRLESHLGQMAAQEAGEGEAGKRMDFLLQEMNREATTILSKTSGLNHAGAAIGAAAIGIKLEIDKLREQVQNIE